MIRLEIDMEQQNRLNIGAGRTYIPGFSNIDISKNAEISIDIGKEMLPFDDDSIDLIFSYHTLEHVGDYLFALGEIHRVLKHGAILLLGVPYISSSEFNLINPYHKNHFSEHSFDFFTPGKLKGSAVEKNEINFQKIFHRFHYMNEFSNVKEPMLTWCRRHLFNVVRKIDFGLVAIKEGVFGESELIGMKQSAIVRFDQCLGARVPYDQH